MMGSGKTTVGAALAARLGMTFVDVDDEVAGRTGRKIGDLWAQDSEVAFRQAEATALTDLLRTDGPLVVATGGGAVVDPASRRLLADTSTVVWLRAPVAVLAARLESSSRGDRPLLGGDPAATLARLLARREALYAEVADLAVDATGSPDAVAAAIATELAARGGNARSSA
jgi:shikimate kinase